ncbi:Coiled-Coil Domain-Containing Protein 91 [Manis pentadactyla]|nr:Coiled-Coil Domain-Containing Protein 91 [Manis pentadactyla]
MASGQSRSSAHHNVRLEAGPRRSTRELHPAELVLMLVQPTNSGFGGSHPAGSWEIGTCSTDAITRSPRVDEYAASALRRTCPKPT